MFKVECLTKAKRTAPSGSALCLGFLLEELVHFLVQYDFLLEDVSTRFRRLNHLDALRVT